MYEAIVHVQCSVCAQALQNARQSRALAQLSGLKPAMLASSVQAVVACNATAPRVCTSVLFILSSRIVSITLSKQFKKRFEEVEQVSEICKATFAKCTLSLGKCPPFSESLPTCAGNMFPALLLEISYIIFFLFIKRL